MPWVAQDDQFFHNPKARAVGPFGRELFSASWCWCSNQLNDGCFVAEDVPVIAALAQVEPSIADLLYDRGLWHPEGTDCAKCRAVGQTMPVPSGRVSVHEYLKQNKTRAQVLAEREANAERQRRYRASRRDSHGDKRGESRPPPSPPRRDISSQSSTDPLPANGESRPDDDGLSTVPGSVWEHYAALALAKQPAGSVKNSTAWKRTTAANARTEHASTAERWHADYDVTAHQLAAALIDGKAPAEHYRRREPA